MILAIKYNRHYKIISNSVLNDNNINVILFYSFFYN